MGPQHRGSAVQPEALRCTFCVSGSELLVADCMETQGVRTQNQPLFQSFWHNKTSWGLQTKRVTSASAPKGVTVCVLVNPSRDTQARWSSTRALAPTSGRPSPTCRTSRRRTPGLPQCTAAAVLRNTAARRGPVPLSQARSCLCLWLGVAHRVAVTASGLSRAGIGH